MIVINFKNYVTGERAIALAKLIEKYLPEAIIAVSTEYVFEVCAESRLKVYGQHVDVIEDGRGTGFIAPSALKKEGASGSLLNHSEHQLKIEVIKRTMKEAQKAKLNIILCAGSVEQARKFIKLKPRPYAIAFEDKKLIASGKSITNYKAGEVKRFVKVLKGTGIRPLCGAGIHSAEDIAAAGNLGCKGVLIASAIAAVPLKKAEKLLMEISLIQ
jgi:triosephosphate isomerase (TIM)